MKLLETMNPLNLACVYPAAAYSAAAQNASAPGDCAEALALVLRAQDPYTRGHARRVAAYSHRIARQLGLPAEEALAVSNGGLLHDIGKIAFSPQLLRNKDSRLSESMQEEIRLHPEIGFKLLRSLQVSESVLQGVRYHHERIDGTGYPCRLMAEEIPLSAKIISVADCYDALTTNRPYQRGKSKPEAMAILERLAGVSLDGAVIAALRAVASREGLRARTA
jgi:putative nucleotidyltransferase with HDIG domain